MSEENAKPRVDTSVPQPPTQQLSEEEKKALELSGQIEHEHGRSREKMHDAARDLGDEANK